MTAGRADERAETSDPRPMVVLARLYEAELLSDRGSLAREVVRLTAELEQQRQRVKDEERGRAAEAERATDERWRAEAAEARLAAAQQALTEAHAALYRARCGLDLGAGCARDLGDDERLRAQLEYLDDARGQWREMGDALASLSAGAADTERTP